jgi:3-oxoacyl-(acyl-carrier-protein) synthase III
MRPCINGIGIHLPERIVSSSELEQVINQGQPIIPEGSIERLFGVRERRFAAEQIQASDLAANAAREMLGNHNFDDVDCLIFASACGDLIEPATANIVQAKLGLHCPSFDVKNACNSFVSALQIACSFIQSGGYRKILITSGEKLSNSIRFNLDDSEALKRNLASLSFGDAGAAVMVETSPNGSGMYFQKFKTVGKHWPLCTVPGGGSLYPHDADKLFFDGRTSELAVVFAEEGVGFVRKSVEEAGWAWDDIDLLFTHQVSTRSFEALSFALDVPLEKIVRINCEYGNIASVSIPLSLHLAEKQGRLRHGSKIAMIGLAAGISISVQLMVWK